MKERPVIFNGEMVRAILDGRKTQTRRVINPQPTLSERTGFNWKGAAYGIGSTYRDTVRNFANCFKVCPFGQVGDRLWVRETFADVNTDGGPAFTYRADHGLKFCLDDESPVDYDRYPGKNFAMWCSDLWNGEDGHSWSPSIHMPRWASRITLEITAVRVERLNDISEEDAKAEGAAPSQHIITPPEALYRVGFLKLWQSIYGEESWADNPWVWVIEFKQVSAREVEREA